MYLRKDFSSMVIPVGQLAEIDLITPLGNPNGVFASDSTPKINSQTLLI